MPWSLSLPLEMKHNEADSKEIWFRWYFNIWHWFSVLTSSNDFSLTKSLIFLVFVSFEFCLRNMFNIKKSKWEHLSNEQIRTFDYSMVQLLSFSSSDNCKNFPISNGDRVSNNIKAQLHVILPLPKESEFSDFSEFDDTTWFI